MALRGLRTPGSRDGPLLPRPRCSAAPVAQASALPGPLLRGHWGRLSNWKNLVRSVLARVPWLAFRDWEIPAESHPSCPPSGE